MLCIARFWTDFLAAFFCACFSANALFNLTVATSRSTFAFLAALVASADLLLSDKIDLGVVAYPESRTRIDTLALWQDDLVLIVSENHRFKGKGSILLSDINNEPFVAFEEGIPTREAIDKILKQRNITIDIRMTNDNIYTLKKVVTAGIGVSIVPARAVEEDVTSGRLSRIKIKDIDLARPLSLLKLKKNKLNPPLEAFVEKLLAFDG